MGRVRVQDVEAHGSAPKAPTSSYQHQLLAAAEEDDGRITREKMTRRRQTIAKRLLEVRQSYSNAYNIQ